jgi:hypothetical protein
MRHLGVVLYGQFVEEGKVCCPDYVFYLDYGGNFLLRISFSHVAVDITATIQRKRMPGNRTDNWNICQYTRRTVVQQCSSAMLFNLPCQVRYTKYRDQKSTLDYLWCSECWRVF